MDRPRFHRSTWLQFRLALLLGTRLVLGAEMDDAEVSERRDWFRRRLSEAVQGSSWLASRKDALESAAKGGSAEARLALAQRLENGIGMPADFGRAEILVRQAAESGHAKSQFLMGQVEAEDAFSPGGFSIGNPRVAEEWWEKAAAQGHVQAMVQLGQLYRYGKLGWDHPKAAAWYLKAAKMGDVVAMREYGEIYADDHDDLEHDYVLAETWLRKAADRGDSQAMLSLGHVLRNLPGRERAALAWIRRAAAEGEGRAVQEMKLGEFAALTRDADALRKAWLSLPKDEDGVLRQLTPLIRGDSNPMPQREFLRTEFSRILRGRDPRPLIRALIQLHREAAPENLETLRNPLLGLPEDDTVVTDPGLCFELAELFWSGSASVAVDRQKAVAWFLRSAQRGDVRAMRRIAALWRDGSIGGPDPIEANRWDARATAVERR